MTSLTFSPDQSEQEAYFRGRQAYRANPNYDFMKLKSVIGMEAATRYCQVYFQGKGAFKSLQKSIEYHQNEYQEANRNYELVVVLPPTHLLGGDHGRPLFQQMSRLGLSLGFSKVSQARLNSNHAIEGARRLFQILQAKQKMGKKIILVSFSFGSAFFRILLDQVGEAQLPHVKSWINCSGLIFGTPRFHCSDNTSILQKTDINRRSFSCEQRYFTRKLSLSRIRPIHVLGLASGHFLNFSQRRRRHKLSVWGPNDGWVCFSQYQDVPGVVWPIFEKGHILDINGMGSLMGQLLCTQVSPAPGLKLRARESTPILTL